MSTRSSIAVVNSDGTVHAVYCHFDGYVKGGVGGELFTFHNSFEKAKALVALGDLSSVSHGVESAYSRDRGEDFDDVKPRVYRSYDDYFENVGDDIGDNGFKYVFKDNTWFCRLYSDPTIHVLSDLLLKEDT